MEKGTGNYTIQGIIENILVNMDVIHTYVQEGKEEGTAAFFLAKHSDKESKSLISGTIVGSYPETVRMLATAMESDEEVAEYIFDSVKHFLASSGSINVGIVKIPTDSNIGTKIKEFLEKRMGGNNKSDKN